MSEQAIQAANPGLSAATLEAVVIGGDLSRLTAAQRLEYYSARCRAAGLDPSAQPFQYIQLNGRLVLYATKGCTDQLSSVHGIKVSIVAQATESGLRVVHSRAESKDGRATEDIGAVNVEGLKGEALANAMMKAVTKAKRRAILSMCGLGMLDETETETIPGARVVAVDTSGAILTQTPDGQTDSRSPRYENQGQQPRAVRGIPITIPESWIGMRSFPIKGKSQYAKLTWAEVDTQPDPSPFTEWLEAGVNSIIVAHNKAKDEGRPNVPLPAAQRALLAFERLLERRSGVEATCPLTEEEMRAADRESDMEPS